MQNLDRKAARYRMQANTWAELAKTASPAFLTKLSDALQWPPWYSPSA